MLFQLYADGHSDEYLLDIAVDKVDQDRLFDVLASEIGHFPARQKQAILIDLANRMYFDEEPTSLQDSFLGVGIELRQYRQSLPDDQRERGRHISLCSQAYKRVARLACNTTRDSKELTRPLVSNPVSTSDTKERTETNMIPSARSSSQRIQTADIADTPTVINANEEDSTQSSNTASWISTLSEPYKTSLHMRMIEKKTYQEIADSMCLPIGTVKSHVSRGKQILQQRMGTNKREEQKTNQKTEDGLLSTEHVLKQVPEPYRTVLRLRCIEKQAYATIAAKLGIPLGTVKSYINRGKKFLSEPA